MPRRSQRLDALLVQRGEVSSREKARRLIMAGGVRVNDKVVDKPGKQVPYDSVIIVQGTDIPYVSRGGLKLQKAIDHFGVNVTGKVVIDVGASTGGFTDCLLQNGAKFVYAVDVGYGQLDWKIREDERVAVLERTNIRYVRPEQFRHEIDLATIDVSFISLCKVIPVVVSLMQGRGQIIALIKPQFEAGRHDVGKGGVVRDPDIHRRVIQNICDLADRIGLTVRGLTYSPIKGPAGNMEYLIWLGKNSELDTPAGLGTSRSRVAECEESRAAEYRRGESGGQAFGKGLSERGDAGGIRPPQRLPPPAQSGDGSSNRQRMIDKIVSEAHAAFIN